ncbi:hypothetical protein [Pseudohaliea sp.]|uniref:hypothetical protein n=1 Tax=Pseudohaliea sp. TaxID=2740289 RepID=UPI0032EF8ED6
MPHANYLITTLLLGLLAGLAGCTKDEDPGGVIPEGYKQSMEKAGNVEQQLQDAADKRLEALDKGE